MPRFLLHSALRLLCLSLLFACSGPAPSGLSKESPATPESAPLLESTPPSSSARSALPPAPEPKDLLVDIHLDTITAMMEGGVPWTDRSLEASLPELLEAGVDVVVQAAWIPRGDPNPRGTGIGKIRRIRNMVRQSKGQAALVTGPDQLLRVVAEGRLAVVIALEGGTALTAGADTLKEFRDLGLSMVGLTWTESSPYADSSAEPRSGDAGGLTPEGREIVTLANDLGLMIDVSHMSDRATDETIALSRAPVLASHSNARSICDVPRNLRDSQIRAIAAKGGLVGAMFHGPFVSKGQRARRQDVVRQLQGLVRLAGAEHVGLGSDWDGKIQSPLDLNSPAHFRPLSNDLGTAGMSASEIAGIRGLNFLRFWRAVEAARVAPKAR